MNIAKINPYILNNNLSGYSSQKVKPYILVKNPEYKLPDEVSDLYEQVEYLESTGKQYIDTNYQAKEGDEITVEAQFTSISENQEMGTLSGGWITYCGTYTGKFIFARSTWKAHIDADTDRHIFYLSNTRNGVAKVDDVVMSLYTSYVNTEDMFIFSRSGSVICKCKVYRVIFAEDGMIIRNFIPVKRKADNKPGLLDIINNVFYTNASGSAQDFIVGNAISKYIPQKVKINILNSSSRLPSEYQQVEYLESTGEQWITTSIVPDIVNGFSYVIKQKQVRNDTGNNQYVLSNYLVYQVIMPSIYFGLHYNDVLSTELHELNATFINSIGCLYIDNNLQYSDAPFLVNESLTIFNRMDAHRPAQARLYYLRLFDNVSLLTHDFIPCYRKTDNKPGLYDLVNDVFYTNANTSASQDFIVGLNVN